jgi:molybdenum cofactor cytidylyltransferase
VIAALLLAAGSARRFGAPKLLQDVHGKPVVRWSAELLRRSPIDEVFVVVPAEHTDLRQALVDLDVKLVVNGSSDDGIGSSLACGVGALGDRAEAVLVMLADEPMLGRDGLRRVVERYRAGGAQIVVPIYRGTRGHPVLFDRSVFAELRALSGDHGAREVTEREPARVALVTLDTERPIDVDTPGDLERLRAVYSPPSLLDDLMPVYDVRASYGVDVDAPVRAVYRAVLETDLASSLVSKVLMAIRSLGRNAAETFRFGELPARGPFFALGSDPPREIVAGIIGRFWVVKGGVADGDRAAFAAPLPAGMAKAAWSFRVDEKGAGSCLTTETRVLCADDAARRQFLRYWTLIGPFSGVIRREALRLIRAQAQFTSTSTSPLR